MIKRPNKTRTQIGKIFRPLSGFLRFRGFFSRSIILALRYSPVRYLVVRHIVLRYSAVRYASVFLRAWQWGRNRIIFPACPIPFSFDNYPHRGRGVKNIVTYTRYTKKIALRGGHTQARPQDMGYVLLYDNILWISYFIYYSLLLCTYHFHIHIRGVGGW